MRQGLQYELSSVMPNLVAESGLFVSLATFQLPDGQFGSTGQPSGNFIDAPGLTNIPCTAPPFATGTAIQATEVKELEQILSLLLTHILLDGWYPAVEPVWRAGGKVLIDGVSYDILGVEDDSQHIMTRVRARITSI